MHQIKDFAVLQRRTSVGLPAKPLITYSFCWAFVFYFFFGGGFGGFRIVGTLPFICPLLTPGLFFGTDVGVGDTFLAIIISFMNDKY